MFISGDHTTSGFGNNVVVGFDLDADSNTMRVRTTTMDATYQINGRTSGDPICVVDGAGPIYNMKLITMPTLAGKNTTINTTWNSNKDGTHYSDNDTGEYYHYDGAVYSIHYYSELTSRNSGVESTKNTVDHPTYNFSNLASAKTTYNSKD